MPMIGEGARVSKVVRFDVECTLCPGTGIRRPVRPGVDWPEPCTCGGRQSLSQYQIGRLLDESPRTILRLHECRTTPAVSKRLLGKLCRFMKG